MPSWLFTLKWLLHLKDLLDFFLLGFFFLYHSVHMNLKWSADSEMHKQSIQIPGFNVWCEHQVTCIWMISTHAATWSAERCNIALSLYLYLDSVYYSTEFRYSVSVSDSCGEKKKDFKPLCVSAHVSNPESYEAYVTRSFSAKWDKKPSHVMMCIVYSMRNTATEQQSGSHWRSYDPAFQPSSLAMTHS